MIYLYELIQSLELRSNNITMQTDFRYVSNELNNFFDFLKSNKILSNLLDEIIKNLPGFESKLNEMKEKRNMIITGSELERARVCYVFLQHVIENPDDIYNIPFWTGSSGIGGSVVGSDIAVLSNFFVNNFFIPFYQYIIERIRFRNIILSLIQRFKFRTEWFTKKKLYDEFIESGQKESSLNNCLQLYLYDQGIDFPLSSPESPSGEADIVTRLEFPDSPIIEIKVFDPDRRYDKSYLNKGFRQILKYSSVV